MVDVHPWMILINRQMIPARKPLILGMISTIIRIGEIVPEAPWFIIYNLWREITPRVSNSLVNKRIRRRRSFYSLSPYKLHETIKFGLFFA